MAAIPAQAERRAALCRRARCGRSGSGSRVRVEQRSLGVGEVAGFAAEGDRDVARVGDLDDERDLVLEADFGVALPVQRECVQLAS